VDKIKIGILGSTRGTDLGPILDAINRGALNAEIAIVISNIETAYILERARKNGIPGFFISHRRKEREDFDAEITAKLQDHGVQLILLVGFLRILSSAFCNQWKMKALNVHPSLLPKYAGGMDMDVHAEVLKNGDALTGCTVHFISADVDEGPILIQKECSVDQNDTPETLKNKVQELEGVALIEAIKTFQKTL